MRKTILFWSVSLLFVVSHFGNSFVAAQTVDRQSLYDGSLLVFYGEKVSYSASHPNGGFDFYDKTMQTVGSCRTNANEGCDFYDEKEKFLGTSKKNPQGGRDFYNKAGKKIGSANFNDGGWYDFVDKSGKNVGYCKGVARGGHEFFVRQQNSDFYRISIPNERGGYNYYESHWDCEDSDVGGAYAFYGRREIRLGYCIRNLGNGHDFYDHNGNFTGSSWSNSRGGHEFHNAAEKRIGFSIAKIGGGYEFFDENGQAVGFVTKDGKDYRFFDNTGTHIASSWRRTYESYNIRDGFGKFITTGVPPKPEPTYVQVESPPVYVNLPPAEVHVHERIENQVQSYSPTKYKIKDNNGRTIGSLNAN